MIPKAHIKKSAMVCNSNPRNIEMGGRDRWLSRAHWTAGLAHVVKFQDNKRPCPKKMKNAREIRFSLVL